MLQQIINIVACDGQVVLYFNFTLFSFMSNIHKVVFFSSSVSQNLQLHELGCGTL